MFSDAVLPSALLSLLPTTHCKKISSYNKKPSSSSSSSMASLTTFPTATSSFMTRNPPPKLSISHSSSHQSLISSSTFTTFHSLLAAKKATIPVFSLESDFDSDSEAENLAFFSDNSSNSGIVPYANPFLKAGNKNIVDLESDKEAARLRVDMPGVGKEGVKIWFENGDLKIEGVEMGAEDGSGEMDKEGRKYAITVEIFEPEFLKKDEARAEMENGVLKMVIPKLDFEERKDVVHINVA